MGKDKFEEWNEFWKASIQSMDVKIDYLDQVGRTVIATKSIKKGELIFKEKSLVTVTHLVSSCDYCLQTLPSQSITCEQCKQEVYCSKECQTAAWKEYHEWQCQQKCNLASLKQMARTSKTSSGLHGLLAIRLFSKMQQNKWNLLQDWKDLQSKCITQDLHSNQLLFDHYFQTWLLCRNAMQLPDAYPYFDLSFLVHVLGLFGGNCFGIPHASPTNGPPIAASSLGNVSAFINHSCCDYNAYNKFKGNEIQCFSLKDIAQGEPILYTYVNPSLPFVERAKALQQYGFVCDCRTCKAKT